MSIFTLPTVTAVTATCGRMTCLRRSVRCFLEQDYEGFHKLLIFNNAHRPLQLHLPDLPQNKRVILINSTDKNYSNLGQIYIDALQYVDTDLTVHADDDDIYLSNHLSNGCKGYAANTGYMAYKPKFSYYRGDNGWEIVNNNMEPSIFINTTFLKNTGYYETTSDQHLKWLTRLRKENLLYEDENSEITFVYNWGDGNEIPTYKTSGDPANPRNFNNVRHNSRDFGDGIITPISKQELDKYTPQTILCTKN